MFSIIKTIAENGLFELHKKKAFYLLFVLLILVFIVPLYFRQKFMPFGGHSYGWETACQDMIISQVKFFIFLGLAISILFAAGSVETEISKRTVSSVMIRPIHRWEYLLGRVSSCIAFYFICVASGTLLSYLAALILGCPMPPLFLWGILQRLTFGIAVLLVTFSLGALISSTSTIVIIFVTGIFTLFAPHVPDDLSRFISIFKQLVHYITPADWESDFLSKEFLQEDKEFSLWMNVLVIAENLMYGISFFLASAWIYTKKDLKLRET